MGGNGLSPATQESLQILLFGRGQCLLRCGCGFGRVEKQARAVYEGKLIAHAAAVAAVENVDPHAQSRAEWKPAVLQRGNERGHVLARRAHDAEEPSEGGVRCGGDGHVSK